MDTYPIFKELIPTDLHLDQIFLDPNNPRFVSMDWNHVSDERISEEKIQRYVIRKLEEEFSIDRLTMNMEINGFLPIDRVIVREFTNGKYVVLEGNRRICAAKLLKFRYDENPDSISAEIIESISSVSCLVYTGTNSEASWIFQGLRHIMGIQEWSAFNKARLIVTLMEEEQLNLTDVGKRFGLTAFGAGQWVRGYFAFKQAKEESDFSKEVDERSYPYFQELFSRSNAPIREWLKWNETQRKFDDELNFNEFIGWLYPRNYEEIDESIDQTTITGDWKNRKILSRDGIRTLSFLFSKSPKEFEMFRAEGSLERAYTIALQKEYEEETKKMANPTEELFDSIDIAIKNLENIPFKIIKDSNLRDRLFAKLEKINAIYKEVSE